MYAVGSNSAGQLGIGHRDDASSFAPVDTSGCEALFRAGVAAVACGGNLTAVVDAEQRLWASGSWTMDRADDSMSSFRRLAGADEGVRGVSCGWEHVLAIGSRSGALYAWGLSKDGRMGLAGERVYDEAVQVDIVDAQLPLRCVAAGWRHSVVVDREGAVFASGVGRTGVLGAGQTGTTDSFVRVHAGAMPPVLGVVCTWQGAVAWDATGVYAWGASRYGECGRIARVCADPCPIALGDDVSVAGVAAGWHHVAVVDTQGRVHARGRSSYGQLGGASGAEVVSLFASVGPVASIACGSQHTMCCTVDGAVYTCGWGEHGQLGVGSTTDASEPVRVPPLGCLAIAAGSGHSVLFTRAST